MKYHYLKNKIDAVESFKLVNLKKGGVLSKHTLVLLFAILFAFSSIRPQVPNGGFEEWTSGINPDYWAVSISPEFSVITKTSDSHSGQWAVRGECMLYSSSNSTIVAPALVSDGDLINGFPANSRYTVLQGFYKLFPQGGDKLFILVNLFSDTLNIGHGGVELDSASDYTQFNVPIQYYSQDIPDSYSISITINSASLGSVMYLDDLEFALSERSISGLQNDFKPSEFYLNQNYPNPFNPSTKISWQSPVSGHQTLKVFDVLGNEVATLVDEYKEAGRYEVNFDASKLSSGIYFYKLQTGSFVETKKMILMK